MNPTPYDRTVASLRTRGSRNLPATIAAALSLAWVGIVLVHTVHRWTPRAGVYGRFLPSAWYLNVVTAMHSAAFGVILIAALLWLLQQLNSTP